jgi:hypothetical protein
MKRTRESVIEDSAKANFLAELEQKQLDGVAGGWSICNDSCSGGSCMNGCGGPCGGCNCSVQSGWW